MRPAQLCIIASLALLATTACKKKEEAKSETKTAALPTAPSKPSAGVAYLAADRMGLVRLAEGRFQTVLKAPDSILHMARTQTGIIYAYAIGGTYRIDGATATRIGDYRNPGSLDRIALGPDGTLWGATFGGVARWDGRGWTIDPKDALGSEVRLLRDLSADARGRVWAVSSNAIHLREGDTWRRPDFGSAGVQTPFFERVAIGPSGTVYFAHSSGVITFDGRAWRALPLGGSIVSLRHLALGPNEALYVLDGSTLIVRPKDGEPKRIELPHKVWVQSLAVDGRGRSWILSDNGLYVVQGPGGIRHYPTGSILELASAMKAVVVVGDGPELPPVGAVAKAALRGNLLENGEPLAGRELELCANPSSIFQTTPCTEAPWHGRARSDEGGVFTFKDVPLGVYRLAIRRDGKWSVGLSPIGAGMRPGETHEVGNINLR